MQKFHKYVGAGNDFVMLDFYTHEKTELTQDLIEKICHRRFGIGADGLITIENSGTADFAMRYYNSDGKEGSMCGNGGRCAVRFASDLGIIDNETIFEAIDGMHKAAIANGLIELQMQSISEIKKSPFGEFVDTGSPHVLIECNNVEDVDAYNKGKIIRNDAYFSPYGTNVNFYSVNNEDIHLKTFERGVEDVTWACGTGSVAAAIVAHYKGTIKKMKDIKVISKGGVLNVSFDCGTQYNNVWLKGPAVRIYSGYDFGK